jgi:hypothetical protein
MALSSSETCIKISIEMLSSSKLEHLGEPTYECNIKLDCFVHIMSHFQNELGYFSTVVIYSH